MIISAYIRKFFSIAYVSKFYCNCCREQEDNCKRIRKRNTLSFTSRVSVQKDAKHVDSTLWNSLYNEVCIQRKKIIIIFLYFLRALCWTQICRDDVLSALWQNKRRRDLVSELHGRRFFLAQRGRVVQLDSGTVVYILNILECKNANTFNLSTLTRFLLRIIVVHFEDDGLQATVSAERISNVRRISDFL